MIYGILVVVMHSRYRPRKSIRGGQYRTQNQALSIRHNSGKASLTFLTSLCVRVINER